MIVVFHSHDHVFFRRFFMNNTDARTAQFNKMTQTPIGKLVIMLGIPTTISMLITTIYNLADTYFVSQLGTSASGAVGVVFSLMSVIQAFGFMYGQGAGSIISRQLGAGKVDEAKRTSSLAFATALVTGVILAVLGNIFVDPLVRLLGSTETILPYARVYARCVLAAAPFMMGSNVLNNILRYEGRAAFAMVGLGLGGILNTIGDPLLIDLADLGVLGAGLSTAISQFVAFSILLYMFITKAQSRFSIKLLSFNAPLLFDICATGFPSLLRQSMQSISGMFLNNTAAALGGDAAVAAMSIVGRINFFCFAVGLGLGQGFQPVSAFNFGAKKYDRVRKSYMFTWAASQVILTIAAAVCLIFSGDLVALFRDDPEVILIGTLALRLSLVAVLALPFQVCTNMLLQSTGQRAAASFLSILKNGLFFIPLLLILSSAFGILGVQVSQPIADVLTSAASIPFAISFMRKLNVMEADGLE